MSDLLRAQGNLAAALHSYKAAQVLRERLVTADPGNAGWQNDLAFSHSNIADCSGLTVTSRRRWTAIGLRKRSGSASSVDPGNAGMARTILPPLIPTSATCSELRATSLPRWTAIRLHRRSGSVSSRPIREMPDGRTTSR